VPHVTIEYSSNVTQDIDGKLLLSEVSSIVSAAGEITAGNFKSRLLRRDEYHVGEGSGRDAFVHVEIGVFSGKPSEVKRRIGEDCLDYLEEYFSEAAGELSLQITVEIREIDEGGYFKSTPGG